jgi:hypothetical protein
MLRIPSLLVVSVWAAACTSQPTTTVSGVVTLKASDVPPTPNPFDSTLDTIDRVRIEVYDLEVGKTVQSVDGPGSSVQFALDGITPSEYKLTATASHHQVVLDIWEDLGATDALFSTDRDPVDLGELTLVYQPEY